MIVDLFAGPGGWDEGVRDLGLEPVGFEIDTAACATAIAAGHKREQVDVREVDLSQLGRVTGIIASPPCQGFSMAGKGKGRADSELLLKAIPHMRPDNIDRGIAWLHEQMTDDRSLLVLEPLRWAMALGPRWMAWEQVPAVLPIWQACADVLRRAGYSVATGNLQAEQYGVPQTRKRAILVAHHRQARLPVPTHSRYYPRDPKRLDEGVLPWVSMAQALGWGMTRRPYPTVAVGTAAGGTDPQALDGSGARRGVLAERADGRWIEKEWDDSPENWRFMGAGASHRDGQLPRDLNSPAHTITGKGTAAWSRESVAAEVGPRVNNQSGTAFDLAWPADRPAPVVAGREIVTMPGANANRFNGATKSRNDGVRVTVAEAGILQSFPADYPWQGTKSQQYQQVGDAVPPLLARAIVKELL